ncbi:AAA family ATPase [Vulcanisaeta distributa]|uniref:ATPase associated with various cellular activities AAA_3 n=1 Tax=Vulcanisaeta distributa (strain DSM 14429 / JCM 11212 / NBRC 100878 / IC-017) TaxID=572478 RepID=E1QU40_VULDI|nr:MoxR family ATPase [Vulcanisaeta distributa]ADN49837.1 ATPase associated with various cellular activities AAA_3 [Vulcanisaeta distributa DSM 14429]
MSVKWLSAIKRIKDGISRVFIGNEPVIQTLLATLLSEGHALLLGPIGSGKTTLAKALASIIGGTFKRVQMTNETLPSDILGFMIYAPGMEPRLVKGPIFANVVLLDEINRAPPRTLSALIEAMQEGQVTIDGTPLELPKPHIVLATMNIVEVELGYTQALPMAILDRFMSSIYVNYVSDAEEAMIVKDIDRIERELYTLSNTISLGEVVKLMDDVKGVYVDDSVLGYIMGLIKEIRSDPRVQVTLSTRAPISLFKLSRALAYLDGRDYVLPDDVKAAVYPALMHRIILRPEYRGSVTPMDVINDALNKVPVPHYIQTPVKP